MEKSSVAIQVKLLNEVLQILDIEGLIEPGAPADEYSSEAEDIAAAISLMPEEDLSSENFVILIKEIWANSFELDENEVAKRIPEIEKLAAVILESLEAN